MSTRDGETDNESLFASDHHHEECHEAEIEKLLSEIDVERRREELPFPKRMFSKESSPARAYSDAMPILKSTRSVNVVPNHPAQAMPAGHQTHLGYGKKEAYGQALPQFSNSNLPYMHDQTRVANQFYPEVCQEKKRNSFGTPDTFQQQYCQ